jgi:hypothetical protein
MSTNPLVFIETAPQTRELVADRAPAVLLDPPGSEVEARPAGAPAAHTPGPFPIPAIDGARRGGREVESVFRAPALALVAAVAIIAGYRWLGVIPSTGSHLSSLAFGRAGVLVMAVADAAVALAVTRPTSRGRRPWLHRLVVLASLMVVTASVVLAWLPGAGTRHALGVCDLVLASTIAGTLVIDERRRHRAEPTSLSPSAVGATDRALPVS